MSKGRIVAFAIFGTMVFGSIAFMIYDHIRFAAASSWPSVEGRVTESDVLSNGGGGKSATTYSASVHYAYAVGGRRLTGYRIWLTAGYSFDSVASANEFLHPYRTGNAVRVFYDPADPSDSALRVERGGDPMILIILFGLLGLVGTYYYPRLAARFPPR